MNESRKKEPSEKRTSHFGFLSDAEVTRMEDAIRSAYGKGEGKEP